MSTNLNGVDSPNLQIALGRIAGYDRLAAFGLTNGLTSGTTVVVSTTGTVFDWPTIATVLDIVSTDAGDTPTAAGVGTVTISGVDGSFAEIQELVVLNGTTIVNTSNSFLRIDTFSAAVCGSTAGYNAAVPLGVITATHGTEILATIPIGNGADLCACATVPAGKKMVLDDIICHVDDGGTDVQFDLIIRFNTNPADATTLPVIRTKLAKISTGTFTIDGIIASNAVLDEFTDVWIEATASAGGSADVTATIIYHIVDKD